QLRKNEPLQPASSSSKLEPVAVPVAQSASEQAVTGSPAVSSAPMADRTPEPVYVSAAEPQASYSGQHSAISPVVPRQVPGPIEYMSPQLPPTSIYVDTTGPMSVSGSMDAGLVHGSPYQHSHGSVHDRFSSPIMPSGSQQQQQMHSPHMQTPLLVPAAHRLTQPTTTSLDEQVHNHISPYFQSHSTPPQPPPQQQHQQQQQPYVAAGDPENQNDSVRNSMSLRNLMSP
ncbi:hypothetical protein EC988_007092, partial [Linderina pennispora]